MKAEFEVKFEVVQKIDGAFVNYSESMSEVFELPFNKGVCYMNERNCTYIAALKKLSQIFKPKSKTVDYSIRTKNICKI